MGRPEDGATVRGELVRIPAADTIVDDRPPDHEAPTEMFTSDETELADEARREAALLARTLEVDEAQLLEIAGSTTPIPDAATELADFGAPPPTRASDGEPPEGT